MSGYLADKVNDMNSGPTAARATGFRMGQASSPEQLAAALKSAILGQDAAVEAVVRALTIAAAGIRDPHRPIASLLLAGPTGVGKTELARRLAAEVTGDPDKMCRIDMNSLAQEHYSASLTGAPPGYSGSKEQFTLFDRELVEGNLSRPGIVLFDEVEKAHTTVLRSLLQILDTGTLRLSAGTSTISFRNSIVLLTSNLGSAELATGIRTSQRSLPARLLDLVPGLPREQRPDNDAVLRAIQTFFDPELYNRFDEIVRFGHLDRENSRAIVDLELSRLRSQLKARAITWAPTVAVRDHLVTAGFDAIYGARNLKRTIRTDLHAPVAAAIVGAPPGPLTIVTTVVNSQIVATSALPSQARNLS